MTMRELSDEQLLMAGLAAEWHDGDLSPAVAAVRSRLVGYILGLSDVQRTERNPHWAAGIAERLRDCASVLEQDLEQSAPEWWCG